MKGHYISNGNRLLTSNTLSPLFITFFDALRRHQLINRNLRILESLFALFSLIPLTRIVVTPAINDDFGKTFNLFWSYASGPQTTVTLYLSEKVFAISPIIYAVEVSSGGGKVQILRLNS